MDRLRNLPLWLRIFLGILPFLLCIPLLSIAFFGYLQYAGWQAATVTAAEQETKQARAATEQFAATVAAAEAATADFAAQQAEAATAQALLLEQQALTQTALVPPTLTATLAPTETVPTETPTRPAIFATPTPKTIIITLRECRGFEGTVVFGNAPAQSLHAYASISFDVPPGAYTLRIDWAGHPNDNINQEITFTASQTLAFGNQCR